MEFNLIPVLICGVLSMVLGMLWYGPLFGKTWMRVIKANPEDMKNPEYRKKMQKQAMPLYALQFALTLFQAWVVSYFMNATGMSGFGNAIWIWAGIVLPIVAGTAMWNNDSKSNAWARFFTQAGYQLVLFIIFGLVL